MAKGCISHAIQYDIGEGWYTGVGEVFRGSQADLRRRWEKAIAEIPDGYSVRLVEVKVLKQHNRRGAPLVRP